KSGLIFFGTFILAIGPVLGGMGFFHTPMDILSNSLPLLLLIATIEDFLIISFIKASEGGNWKKTFRQFISPCFFTSLTTVVGFGSLAIADLNIIKRFGTWAAVGALLEWVSVFYLLPAFLQIFPRLRVWVDRKKAFNLSWVSKLNGWRPPRVA